MRAAGLILTSLLLVGCAAAPPMPLTQYVGLRDQARDYLGHVETVTCAKAPATDRDKSLCRETRALRQELAPVDATMLKGYEAGGLSKEQWSQALGAVMGVVTRAFGAAALVP